MYKINKKRSKTMLTTRQNEALEKDGNDYAIWDNEHSCPQDDGTRSFCENCGRDHHSGGWESHGVTAKQDAERNP